MLTVMGIHFTLAFVCLIAKDQCSDRQNSELTRAQPSHPRKTEQLTASKGFQDFAPQSCQDLPLDVSSVAVALVQH